MKRVFRTAFVIVSLSVLFYSCKGIKFRRDINRFFGSEVVVPVGIRQICHGLDTVITDTVPRMATLIVYADSMSCASCQINHMYQYKELIDFQNEVGKGYAPFFIFTPRSGQGETVRYTLSVTRFYYPILLDEAALFPGANPQIPSDIRFHVFLLDREGRVVLIGDPSRNPTLWDLYKKTISDLIASNGLLSYH